jgi:hypothetical protein
MIYRMNSPPRPAQLWGPPSLLSNGYQGSFLGGKKAVGRETDHSPPSSAEIKVCVELYLHSPNTPSWRGAQLKQRDYFTFTFTFTFYSLPYIYGTEIKCKNRVKNTGWGQNRMKSWKL